MRSLLRGLGLVVMLALAAASRGGEPGDSPLPSREAVVAGLLERAEADAAERQRLEEDYYYVRTQIREERSPAGKLRQRSEKQLINDPVAAEAAMSRERPPGQGAYTEKDVDLGADLVRRFDYEVEDRELVGDQVLLRVSFRPASDDLPTRNLVDRFINRTAGTLWLDEESFALVKARMALLEHVNFLGGIAGVVHRLEMTFEREPTPDGLWYTRRGAWVADYRQFLVHKVVHFQEERTEIRRAASSAEAVSQVEAVSEP